MTRLFSKTQKQNKFTKWMFLASVTASLATPVFSTGNQIILSAASGQQASLQNTKTVALKTVSVAQTLKQQLQLATDNAAAQVSQQQSQEVVQKQQNTAGEFQSTLDALNALRAANGLSALRWDSQLATVAASRAALTNNSGIPVDHYSVGGEVIAIGFGLGQSVINAWYNETNMIGSNAPHRAWELNASYTHVAFGMVNGVVVGRAY